MEAILVTVVAGIVVMVVCLSIVAVVALVSNKGDAKIAQEAIKALASVITSWVRR